MSLRCPYLPLLPGYTFNTMIGRTKFNMDPKFDFIGDGVPCLKEKVKPNMFGPLSDKYPSIYPRGEVMELPAWIAFDKQILTFDAFFKETLQEIRKVPFVVHTVKIYYFLEDGTIMVMEPKQDNSGTLQGTLICRHRIRFPAPMDDNFYEMIDFNVGREVEFYGKVFKIVNCDKFTRNFLNRCGIPVPDPINIPKDPHFEVRNDKSAICRKNRPWKNDSLKKFLKNDKKVLRFTGYWDDQETPYGYLHHVNISFYLSDDTIEITETMSEGCNRSSSFMFLRRAKLPKNFKNLPKPGADDPVTVLNVLGSGLQGGRYVMDPLNCNPEAVEYYTEKDLMMGSILMCYGRKIVMTACDDWTKGYFREKFGMDAFPSILTPEDKQQDEGHQATSTTERKLPPWNGYGSFEDSAQNCVTVELKPPHGDFKKFLQLDKVGLDSRVLRFKSKMIDCIPENNTRNFVVSFFLADDTLQVFELAARNSGFDSKAFLARGQVNLPGQNLYEMSEPPLHYEAQHMFIGALIDVNSFKFALLDADEYCLRYMELHSSQFPKANIETIMAKVREKVRPIYKDFMAQNLPAEKPLMCFDKFREEMFALMGDDITEHEIITMSRAFPGSSLAEEKYDRSAIRAIVLTELKRFLWDDLDRLREYFIMRDPNKTGKLTKTECYTVLRACRLPLDNEFLEKILAVIKRDENCNLFYDDILDFLNRCICTPADVVPVNIKREFSWVAMPDRKNIVMINWCAFNKYLDLEEAFLTTTGANTEYFKQAKK